MTLVAESRHLPACRREQPSLLHEVAVVVQRAAAVRYYGCSWVTEAIGPFLFHRMILDIARNRRFLLFTGVVSAAFLLALVLLPIPQSAFGNHRELLGLIAFVVLAVLAQGYPLQVPVGNAFLGLSGTIFWALIILFDPFLSAIAAFASLFISESIIQRRQITKTVFNSTQAGLSTAISAVIFFKLAGAPGPSASAQFLIAFGAATFSYWLLNTWLVSAGAWILYSETPGRFWQRNFRWAFIYELTSAPIALAVAYAYQQLWVVGLLLLTLPILMVRLAYSQYLELKRTYRETVRMLVKIIEMHDPYTAGHSDRVATYAGRLCVALRLSPSTTEKIELAAFLHDLGKIHLDLSNIIRKAGELNEEERRLVRLHSVVSADLANQVSYFKGEIEGMIRHHHESWDGSGYPHGLKGEQIPLGSRIILLADAFDAMTTSRVYRDALDIGRVKDEFRGFSGIQFDPRLVPIFLDQVVGDGRTVVRQPLDDPLEGQRARLGTPVAPAPEIRDIFSRAR